MAHDVWLHRMIKLKKGRKNAPHKPMLLLVVLDLVESGTITECKVVLSPELAFHFETFAAVVAHRRTQRVDVRYPFFHLTNDGFWKTFTAHHVKAEDPKSNAYIMIEPDFLEACFSPVFRGIARRLLISKHFEPAERNALYHLTGVPVPTDDQVAEDAMFEVRGDAAEAGRDGRFRLDVVAAYNFTCALTGYRVTSVYGGSIVDAAHVHQFSESKNNDPNNGMALSKNAHWLFDAGLWSLDDNFCVLVASDAFTELSPNQTPLIEYEGVNLRLPSDKRLWPSLSNVRWHRKMRFRQ
jgi:putative restriction endonuclease